MLELKLLASCIFDPFSRKTSYLFKYGHIMLGNKTNLRYLYLTLQCKFKQELCTPV